MKQILYLFFKDSSLVFLFSFISFRVPSPYPGMPVVLVALASFFCWTSNSSRASLLFGNVLIKFLSLPGALPLL